MTQIVTGMHFALHLLAGVCARTDFFLRSFSPPTPNGAAFAWSDAAQLNNCVL
jgi:hypothetical protein